MLLNKNGNIDINRKLPDIGNTIMSNLHAAEDYKIFVEEEDDIFIKVMSMPLNELPLHINDTDIRVVTLVKWRLEAGK